MVGDDVMIQNQRGNYPRRWDKRGVVVEVLDHDQYQVRVKGSGKLTLRNRRYLRKYNRFQPPPFAVIPMEVESSQNDRDDDPVPAQMVQVPMLGDVADDEGVQPDDVAVGHPADQILINDPDFLHCFKCSYSL